MGIAAAQIGLDHEPRKRLRASCAGRPAAASARCTKAESTVA